MLIEELLGEEYWDKSARSSEAGTYYHPDHLYCDACKINHEISKYFRVAGVNVTYCDDCGEIDPKPRSRRESQNEGFNTFDDIVTLKTAIIRI
ncbi:MAG TPA: hypothetical protein PLL26_05710 [Candidatus Dojkabacteria bacterium]|nr:hypothetical protein [Candidatus Dojkabacteria bacterium]